MAISATPSRRSNHSRRSNRNSRATLAALLTVLLALIQGAAGSSATAKPADPVDERFAITSTDLTITAGSVGPGSGVIENAGSRDVYTFEVTEAVRYVSVLLTGCGQSYGAPYSAVVIDLATGTRLSQFEAPCEQGERKYRLPRGSYGVRVHQYAADVADTKHPWSYSLRLKTTPAQQFTMNSREFTVGPGSPAPNAGRFTAENMIHEYQFPVNANFTPIDITMTHSACLPGLQVGAVFPGFDAFVYEQFAVDCQKPAQVEGLYGAARQAGMATLVVGAVGGPAVLGDYGFHIKLPGVETFGAQQQPAPSEVGVRPGVPAVGAGVLDMGGDVDVFVLKPADVNQPYSVRLPECSRADIRLTLGVGGGQWANGESMLRDRPCDGTVHTLTPTSDTMYLSVRREDASPGGITYTMVAAPQSGIDFPAVTPPLNVSQDSPWPGAGTLRANQVHRFTVNASSSEPLVAVVSTDCVSNAGLELSTDLVTYQPVSCGAATMLDRSVIAAEPDRRTFALRGKSTLMEPVRYSLNITAPQRQIFNDVPTPITVSPQQPGNGSGMLESPGSVDTYTLKLPETSSSGTYTDVPVKLVDCQRDQGVLRFMVEMENPLTQSTRSGELTCDGATQVLRQLRPGARLSVYSDGAHPWRGSYSLAITPAARPKKLKLEWLSPDHLAGKPFGYKVSVRQPNGWEYVDVTPQATVTAKPAQLSCAKGTCRTTRDGVYELTVRWRNPANAAEVLTTSARTTVLDTLPWLATTFREIEAAPSTPGQWLLTMSTRNEGYADAPNAELFVAVYRAPMARYGTAGVDMMPLGPPVAVTAGRCSLGTLAPGREANCTLPLTAAPGEELLAVTHARTSSKVLNRPAQVEPIRVRVPDAPASGPGGQVTAVRYAALS